MSPISVVINVKDEDVTFTEPSFKDALGIVASLRNIVSSLDFGPTGQDGMEMLFGILANEESFGVVVGVLTKMSGREASFFEDIRIDDAANIFEGFRDSDLSKVLRRFFTKATGTQQTQT